MAEEKQEPKKEEKSEVVKTKKEKSEGESVESKPKVETPAQKIKPSKKLKVPEIPKIEKEFTISLREKCRSVPRYKKANKAIKTIKEFLVRHMKVYDRDLNKIKIDRYVNEVVWARGIKKPPAKIKVKAIKEGDIVRVELASMPEKLKFKKARVEKRDAKAIESKDKKKGLMQKAKEKKEKSKEEKVEESEKTKAGAEATKQLEKAQAKQMKHQAGGKVKEKTKPIRQALEK